LQLNASGTAAQTLFRFPGGTVTAALVFNATGQLLLQTSGGWLLTMPPNYAFDSPAIVGFANAAPFALNTGIYPGELVSLFGFDLAASGQGVKVVIDGLPATIVYAGSTQINFQIPFEISQSQQLQLTLGSSALSLELPFAQSLGIFATDGLHAAAINQDGSVNSASNPAPSG
jgi:hypothetical protein